KILGKHHTIWQPSGWLREATLTIRDSLRGFWTAVNIFGLKASDGYKDTISLYYMTYMTIAFRWFWRWLRIDLGLLAKVYLAALAFFTVFLPFWPLLNDSYLKTHLSIPRLHLPEAQRDFINLGLFLGLPLIYLAVDISVAWAYY